MRCPFCKNDDDKVIDSRASNDGSAIRRRRVCQICQRRYTTYERVEDLPLRVVKKDGTRVPFDRKKILDGLLKACEKRPVPLSKLEETVSRIEQICSENFDREVTTSFIGELVMKELRGLDQVAYVRFASVYRQFRDVSQFLDELRPMLEKRDQDAG